MNALDQLRALKPLKNFYLLMRSDGSMDLLHTAAESAEDVLPVIMLTAKQRDAIADQIEVEWTELPKDADGVPCRIGDRVKSGETYGDIKEMLLFERGREMWEIYLTTLDDSVPADSLHHVERPKLTKEEIDALAKTSCQKYWNCEGYGCNECPAKIQGKNPNVYYEVQYCSHAQILDVLRLERERVAGEQA